MTETNEKDTNDIEITFVIAENLPIPVATLVIPEITEQESLERKLIGTAAGKDPGHCAYIALSYDPTFVTRVKGYRIIQENSEDFKLLKMFHPEAVAVSFYE